jgi:Sugar kinases, ribokinase family
MPTKPRVAVVGSYAQALVLTTTRIPLEGETLIGKDYRETFGGKGSDMAVQAARLGCDVSYLGVIGNDSHGKAFTDLAESEGIDISGLRVSQDTPTGVGMIIKDQSAHNIIVVDRGANNEFSEVDIDRNVKHLSNASVVLAQLEIPLETALYGLRQAKKAGASTILNPAPAVDLRKADLTGIDILTPNETEAKAILGLAANDKTPLSDLASKLLEKGVGAVVMTLGEKGAAVFTGEGSWTVPATSVESVDSNGAGDSFNAGLATGIAEGKSLLDAVSFAVAVSGLCCTRWETVPSYHMRAEVDEYMRSQPDRLLAPMILSEVESA